MITGPRINITLHLDGSVTVQPEGMKGTSCVEFSKPFEEALGMSNDKDKKSPEYYQKETAKQNVRT